MLKNLIVAAALAVIVAPAASAGGAQDVFELTGCGTNSHRGPGYRVPAEYHSEVAFAERKLLDTLAELGLHDAVRVQPQYVACVGKNRLAGLNGQGTGDGLHTYKLLISGALFEKYDQMTIKWAAVSVACNIRSYVATDLGMLFSSAVHRCIAEIINPEELAALYANEPDIYQCDAADIRDCYVEALAFIQSWNDAHRTKGSGPDHREHDWLGP